MLYSSALAAVKSFCVMAYNGDYWNHADSYYNYRYPPIPGSNYYSAVGWATSSHTAYLPADNFRVLHASANYNGADSWSYPSTISPSKDEVSILDWIT